MYVSVLEEKSYFKLAFSFSFKLNWGSCIVSIGKTASKKIGALIFSMQFLSLEVALYFYESIIPFSMEYCCHDWAGAPSCSLKLLDKLQKPMCRAVGPSLVSLGPFAHHGNIVRLSNSCRFCFGRCLHELAQLVPLLYFWLRSTCYPDKLHYFSVTIHRPYKDVHVNSFFPCTARLWKSLPIEWFPLTYDLNG